jgi:hypothetical protein
MLLHIELILTEQPEAALYEAAMGLLQSARRLQVDGEPVAVAEVYQRALDLLDGIFNAELNVHQRAIVCVLRAEYYAGLARLEAISALTYPSEEDEDGSVRQAVEEFVDGFGRLVAPELPGD